MDQKELSKKEKSILMIVSLAIVMAIVLGISYAYFTAGDKTEEQTVTSETLTIGFTNGNIVKSEGISPIEDSEIKTKATELPFTVTNTGSHHMKLTIKLTDIIISDDLKDVDFRWGLYNADTNKGVSFGLFDDVVTGGEEIILQDVILDSGSATKNYVLRIWIHNDGYEQNYMQGETFSAKLKVEGQAIEYTDEDCFTFDESTGTITDYDLSCPMDIVIPKTIDGVTVKKFSPSEGDLAYGAAVTSIIFPDTITEISGQLQEGMARHTTIPESVTTLGISDWMEMSSNHSITIPESVTVWEYGVDITARELIIPGSVNSIMMESFTYTNLILMDGIEDVSFYYSELPNILEIPSSVKVIGGEAEYTNAQNIVVRGKSNVSEFTYFNFKNMPNTVTIEYPDAR